MSLYNMLFGKNVYSKAILAAIDLTEDDVPRFRDCFIRDGKIVVHTRTGGGNREAYEEENDFLAMNKYYEYDEDDDFDCTYANFYFSFPPEYTDDLKALEEKSENATPSDKWRNLLAAMGAAK